MEVKTTSIGLILLLSSAITCGSTLISASIYSQTFTGTSAQGRDSQHGVFGTVIRVMGTIPIIIAALLAIVGIIFIVKSKKD